MFGSSTKKDDIHIGEPASAEDHAQLRIATIPDDFYGGKNPAIYEPTSKKTQVPPPKEVPSPTTEDVEVITEPSPKKTVWIIIGVISFILFVLGVTAYYLHDGGILFAPSSEPEPVVSVPEPIIVPEPEPDPVIEPEIEPEPEIVIPTSSLDIPIAFPALNTSQGPDLDSDSLTDAEELIIGTDPGMWDTDEDGYYDGLEVMNLYNPLGFAPVRIIDSASIVQEYINPVFGYRIYYPQAWNAGAVDTSGREILFSAISGDYIALYTRPMEPGETFQEWFTRNAPSERITNIAGFENRFTVPGFRRSDGLVAYFGVNEIVYTIVYYPIANVPVQYRQIMDMMVQSFRPDTAVQTIPDQRVLPGVVPSGDAAPSVDGESTENILEPAI
jgi:hypothetical protein